MREKICRTGRSQFKDFFKCRLPRIALPQGCSTFAHMLCWIFLNSLRRVLQKSALPVNEIAASKFEVVTWCGDWKGKKMEKINQLLETDFSDPMNLIPLLMLIAIALYFIAIFADRPPE